MRPSLVVLAALVPAAAILPSSARAQVTPAGPTPPAPSVAVSAVGEEQVTPDRARISIGVQTQAPTAADASARNARLQRAVIDTLRALGIPAEQIATRGYQVYPEQQFDQQGRRPRIVGYNVQNTVVVEVRRVEQAGPVLDAALSKGANLVSSLQFYSSQAEEARRRALAKAVAAARADAEAMARAAGGALGEMLELTSNVGYGRPMPMEDGVMMRSAEVAAVGAPTPIAQGTQTVAASVTARWRFVGR